MGKYIPLDALLAEIDRRMKAIPRGETDKRLKAVYGNEIFVLNDLRSFLDTLEVKEVDLQKEIQTQWKGCEPIDEGMGCEFANISVEQFDSIAKHFFELGLKVNQDVDLELIVSWFDHIAQIADDRKTANGVVMVDWAALDEIKCLAKESSEFIKTHYKAQKGE